jgi:hypothetical protein
MLQAQTKKKKKKLFLAALPSSRAFWPPGTVIIHRFL